MKHVKSLFRSLAYKTRYTRTPDKWEKMSSERRMVLTAFLALVCCNNAASVSGAFSDKKTPPLYSEDNMPNTSFNCADKTLGGYYADPETECQMFHVCVRIPSLGVQDFKFLCPNETSFDQENQICDDWYNVNCQAANSVADNFELNRIEPLLTKPNSYGVGGRKEHYYGHDNKNVISTNAPSVTGAKRGPNSVPSVGLPFFRNGPKVSPEGADNDIGTSQSGNFFNSRTNGREEENDDDERSTNLKDEERTNEIVINKFANGDIKKEKTRFPGNNVATRVQPQPLQQQTYNYNYQQGNQQTEQQFQSDKSISKYRDDGNNKQQTYARQESTTAAATSQEPKKKNVSTKTSFVINAGFGAIPAQYEPLASSTPRRVYSDIGRRERPTTVAIAQQSTAAARGASRFSTTPSSYPSYAQNTPSSPGFPQITNIGDASFTARNDYSVSLMSTARSPAAWGDVEYQQQQRATAAHTLQKSVTPASVAFVSRDRSQLLSSSPAVSSVSTTDSYYYDPYIAAVQQNQRQQDENRYGESEKDEEDLDEETALAGESLKTAHSSHFKPSNLVNSLYDSSAAKKKQQQSIEHDQKRQFADQHRNTSNYEQQQRTVNTTVKAAFHLNSFEQATALHTQQQVSGLPHLQPANPLSSQQSEEQAKISQQKNYYNNSKAKSGSKSEQPSKGAIPVELDVTANQGKDYDYAYYDSASSNRDYDTIYSAAPLEEYSKIGKKHSVQ